MSIASGVLVTRLLAVVDRLLAAAAAAIADRAESCPVPHAPALAVRARDRRPPPPRLAKD